MSFFLFLSDKLLCSEGFIEYWIACFSLKTWTTPTTSIDIFTCENPGIFYSSDANILEEIFFICLYVVWYTLMGIYHLFTRFVLSFFDLDFFSCTSSMYEKKRHISDMSFFPVWECNWIKSNHVGKLEECAKTRNSRKKNFFERSLLFYKWLRKQFFWQWSSKFFHIPLDTKKKCCSSESYNSPYKCLYWCVSNRFIELMSVMRSECIECSCMQSCLKTNVHCIVDNYNREYETD